jgi:hypothetical protein
MTIYLVVAAVMFLAAEVYFRLAEPTSASEGVQNEGRALVAKLLERLDPTEFGQSKRGASLISALRDAVAREAVVFATDLDEPGYFCEVRGGVVYVQETLLRGAGSARDRGLVKVLLHEAVHAIQTDGWSVEEECDGYAGGMVAADALEGIVTPELIEVDGRPLIEFVREHYPELDEDRSYEPVGESREWLLRRTGCCGP